MDMWFSSDPHFFHENIIRFCHRPFHTVSEMNEALVENHNALVKPSDHWYCLGDVTMLRDNQGRGLNILRRMNGHKRLILGNHDHYAMKHYLEHFEKVMAMNMFDGMRFTHIPIHPNSMGGAKANIHGHTHNGTTQNGLVVEFPAVLHVDKQTQKLVVKPYVNISVEVTDYKPVNLEWIRAKVKELS